MSVPAARSGSGSRKQVPVGSQPGDVAREALFEAAVEGDRRRRGEDRVAALERHGGEAAAQRAGGAQLEAGAPGEVGQELGQRAAVEQRVLEQRERAGDLQHRAAAARPRRAMRAEQAAQLGEPDDRPHAPLDAQLDARGAHEHRLGDRQVGAQHRLGRRGRRLGRAHRPLAGQIGEQALEQRLGARSPSARPPPRRSRPRARVAGGGRARTAVPATPPAPASARCARRRGASARGARARSRVAARRRGA